MLEYLGIDSSNTQKKERLIEAEVVANEESTEMMRLDGLNSRRQSVKKINEMFNTNIEVVRRSDIVSNNYEFVNTIEENNGGEK